MTSREGEQIGKYRLEKLLGTGAFGEVYLATHIHLNRRDAVKLLLRLDASETEPFRKEAEIVASLDHPNIVKVYDFDFIDGTPLIAMAYASNGTLRGRYRRGTRLPLMDVVRYVKQVAAGLQYAHDRRVLHRDIKPENMLLGTEQMLWISDFGIAVAWSSSRTVGTQDISGTRPYMAPEHFQAHPRTTSDQYALAITAYEWLTGHFPMEGTALGFMQMLHPEFKAPALRNSVPDIPAAVEDVVLHALEANWQARFPSIQNFAEALERAARGQNSQQATMPPQAPQAPAQPPWQASGPIPGRPQGYRAPIRSASTDGFASPLQVPSTMGSNFYNPPSPSAQPQPQNLLYPPPGSAYAYPHQTGGVMSMGSAISATGSRKPLYLPLGREQGKGAGLSSMLGYTLLIILMGLPPIYYTNMIDAQNHEHSTALSGNISLIVFLVIFPLITPLPGALFGKWRGALVSLLGAEIVILLLWVLQPASFHNTPVWLVLLVVALVCLPAWVVGLIYERRHYASFRQSFLSILAGTGLIVIAVLIAVASSSTSFSLTNGVTIAALGCTGVIIVIPMALSATIAERIIHRVIANRHTRA